MIVIEPLSNIIIPRLSVIKPESAFGLYYKILCSSLTDWIDQYLGNQIATVSGTMIVGNYTVPYIAPCLYSELETVVLDPLQLQAESKSGIDLFPKIFEYFGKMISNQLIIWSSLSKFNNLKIPTSNPIKINAVVPLAPINQGFTYNHYYSIGKTFINVEGKKLKALTEKSISIENAQAEYLKNQKIFWDDFEVYLKMAINATPPIAGVEAMGTIAGNAFTGTMLIKLVV